MTKKQILNVLFWSGVALLTVGVIWSVCAYPSILKERLNAKSIVGLGEYGDIYGGLNTLFTGLAFVGLVVTILLQRQEMKETREEFEEQTKQFKAQSEIMTKQVLDAAMFEYLEYMGKLKGEWEPSIPLKIHIQLSDLLRKISKVASEPSWQNDEFWIEKIALGGRVEGTPAIELAATINTIRHHLSSLEAWGQVYVSWINRVDQAVFWVEIAEKNVKIAKNCEFYKQALWKLLPEQDKELLFMVTAFLAEKHESEWMDLCRRYGESLQPAFQVLHFDENMQKLLYAFLAPVGKHNVSPVILSVQQVKDIFLNHMHQ